MKDMTNPKPVIHKHEITDEDREDSGLIKLMMEVDHTDIVSREEIIEKLKEN
jgi:hypothetical protein